MEGTGLDRSGRSISSSDTASSARLGSGLARAKLFGGPAAVHLGACYVAYMLAAAFGYWMIVIPDISITIWPPNGIILAMLLTHPRQTWPWWVAVGAVGELTGNFIWFDNPLLPALGYIVANASAVVMAAFLLTPLLQSPIRRLTSLPQVMAFLGIGVLAAPVLSATIGSAIDAVVGKNTFATTWPLWWLGDATGILIAAPLAISAVNTWREAPRPTAAQYLEGAAIALVLAGLSAWQLTAAAAHEFLLLLPVLWAALRFEFRGAALAVLGLAFAIGIQAHTIETLRVSPADAALLHTKLQTLIVVAASTGLIVAAIIQQHRQAVTELAQLNAELEARVTERTREIEAAEKRFKATFQNAGVGISIISGDGILMQANDRLARMLGYDVEEMEGKPLDQFTHPDDLASGEAAWERLKAGAADEYELEKRYISKDGTSVWGHTTVSCVRDADGQIAYLIKIIQDITERKNSEQVRQLLAREVHHRSKNLLSIVQVIARQTASRSPQDFVESFSQRLQALAANQDLLINSGWQRAELFDIVRIQLEHFGAIGSRVIISGTSITVSPSAAQPLSMALHELATNAAKYGSLSNESGRIEIAWVVEDGTFRMSWRETGGPVVTAPTAKGFGTVVLDNMVTSSLSGEVSMDYLSGGFVWQLQCPLASLDEKSGAHASG